MLLQLYPKTVYSASALAVCEREAPAVLFSPLLRPNICAREAAVLICGNKFFR